MPSFHVVVGVDVLAEYREVLCRPDCVFKPGLTYVNSWSTASSATPAEVMPVKAG